MTPNTLDAKAMVAAANAIDPSGIFGLTWQECLERAEVTISAYLSALREAPVPSEEPAADDYAKLIARLRASSDEVLHSPTGEWASGAYPTIYDEAALAIESLQKSEQATFDIAARLLRERDSALASPAVAPVAAPIRDIATERQRQVEAEGWTPEHDDTHNRGEIAMAAAAYAVSDKTRSDLRSCVYLNLLWPWELTWWKPKDRRHDLVRAGALIVAEIERLDRAEIR